MVPWSLCNRPRTNLTFDYGGECSLLLNSGGWVHVPYVRYKHLALVQPAEVAALAGKCVPSIHNPVHQPI